MSDNEAIDILANANDILPQTDISRTYEEVKVRIKMLYKKRRGVNKEMMSSPISIVNNILFSLATYWVYGHCQEEKKWQTAFQDNA
uniref:Uncharacterized protein n=1 Tax=Arion vulgaris TaxID=1028688 RepID=A0A0B6Y0T5_9EUPU